MSRTCASMASVVALTAVLSAARLGAAPETFNTALPIAEGEAVLREQFVYRRAGDDPSGTDREVEVLGGVSVLGYGIAGDFALFGALPYLDKRLELTSPSGRRIGRSTRGIGDVRLFGRYTLFKRDMRGRTFRVAPFAGLELPTGDHDAADSFGSLPRPLQLGSGSWDPFGGVVVTYQTLDYQFDAQLAYQANTEADGFAFGDEFRFDASGQFRLWPRQLGDGASGFLYGVAEANVIHQRRDRIDGTADPDSGGTQLFLSPGLQYVTRRWVAEAIVQLPVIQKLGGAALGDDYIVRAGIRVNF